MNWLAYKKWWNFSITQATANGSSSIAMYPFYASVRALLAKYTGFSSWSKHASNPFMLASVCKTVCFFGLSYASMGALAISFFHLFKCRLVFWTPIERYLVLWQLSNGLHNQRQSGWKLWQVVDHSYKWMYLLLTCCCRHLGNCWNATLIRLVTSCGVGLTKEINFFFLVL